MTLSKESCSGIPRMEQALPEETDSLRDIFSAVSESFEDPNDGGRL